MTCSCSKRMDELLERVERLESLVCSQKEYTVEIACGGLLNGQEACDMMERANGQTRQTI